MNNKIDVLRKFFAITVAAFELQHEISLAFGYKGNKSNMHLLHINAKEEIEKENPDLNVIDKYLDMMKSACENNPKPDNFEKGGIPHVNISVCECEEPKFSQYIDFCLNCGLPPKED